MKKLLSVALLAGFAFSVFACSSSTVSESNNAVKTTIVQSDDDFEVKQNADNTLTITGYKGRAVDVVIPSTLHGLKVTVIGKEAFKGKGLTSVVIPDTVAIIGEEAFVGDSDDVIRYRHGRPGSLTKVTFGKGLKVIGYHAFVKNQLTDVAIPDSVTDIGNGAFFDNKLTGITLGKSVKSIGDGAFASNEISELTLPAGLKEIGMRAFSGNKIRALVIPDNVILIRFHSVSESSRAKINAAINQGKMDEAISEAVLEALVYRGSRNTGGSFADNPVEFLSVPASLAKRSIWNNETTAGLADGTFSKTPACIILPAGMDETVMAGNFEEALVNFWKSQNKAAGTYIKRGPVWAKASADEANQFLQGIKDSSQVIEKSDFAIKQRSDASLEITGYTGNAKDLVIPAEIGGKPVTRIGAGAFNKQVAAGKITSVTIPDSVTEIGEYAFANFADVTYDKRWGVIGSVIGSKEGKSKLTTVTWGKGLKAIGRMAFWSDSLKTVNAGTSNTQTGIGDGIFYSDGYTPNHADRFSGVWKAKGDKPRTYTKGLFGVWSAK